jgi:hypothetical protein
MDQPTSPYKSTPTDDGSPVGAPPLPGDFVLTGNPAPLFAALAKAQGAFKPVVRSATVTIRPRESAAYQFSYAPLEEVLNATREALSVNGLWLGQPLSSAKGKTQLRTILGHSSGASMTMTIDVPGGGDIKALGSSITYLRRYTVQALLGIAAEEDDDGSAANGDGYERQPRQQQQAPASAPALPAATEGDVKAIIAALGNATSTTALDTIAAGAKSKTWKPEQRRKMQDAYTARKRVLTDPANDAQEPAGAA